jgi:hypothetical protein
MDGSRFLEFPVCYNPDIPSDLNWLAVTIISPGTYLEGYGRTDTGTDT